LCKDSSSTVEGVAIVVVDGDVVVVVVGNEEKNRVNLATIEN
jgi:hypothetical protein